MRSITHRIRALEREHRKDGLKLVAWLDDDVDYADAVKQASVPGLYVRPIFITNSIELLKIDRIDGRLQLVEVLPCGGAATPASKP